MRYFEYTLKDRRIIHLTEEEHERVQKILFSGKHQLMILHGGEMGFTTQSINGWKFDPDFKLPSDYKNELFLSEPSSEIREEQRKNMLSKMKQVGQELSKKLSWPK